jgi:hypothetical protein
VQVPDVSLSSLLQDPPGRLGADPWHPEELFVRGRGEFHRKSLGMGKGPGELGVRVQREIARLIEGELLKAKAVLPEEVFGLV